MPRRWSLLVAAALLLAGCGGPGSTGGPGGPGDAGPTRLPGTSPSLYTLSPLPMPSRPPPTGRLTAEMRQSSRDTLLNRFEVWVGNDTTAAIRPLRIGYRDGRFRTTLPATRLRGVPSRSERGFPIYQPARPACASAATGGTVTVTYRTRSATGPVLRTVSARVQDETDVVGRYTSAGCLERAAARVATLSFADRVPVDPPGGRGADAHLLLVARTSGRAGHTLRIDSITGTPVLSPASGAVWRPGVTLTGDGPDRTIDLPVAPTRCDAHAFAESGGATTFLVGVHLDGRAGQLRILMRPRGSRHAIDYALSSCGLLTTVDGGSAGPAA